MPAFRKPGFTRLLGLTATGPGITTNDRVLSLYYIFGRVAYMVLNIIACHRRKLCRVTGLILIHSIVLAQEPYNHV